LDCTIAKGSSRRSKWIYYLPYLEFRIKIYQFATTHAWEDSRRPEKTPDQSGPRTANRWDRLAPPLCRPGLGCGTLLPASGMFPPRLLGSHLRPFEVGLSNSGRGRSHGLMMWQFLGLYSILAYIRTPSTLSWKPSLIQIKAQHQIIRARLSNVVD
jgi:hypothetical protein